MLVIRYQLEIDNIQQWIQLTDIVMKLIAQVLVD